MRIFLAAVLTVLIVFLVPTLGQSKITPPKPLTSITPVYPPEAREIGLGGTVAVTVRIKKSGKASVINAFGPMVSCGDTQDKRAGIVRKAVIETVRTMTFASATSKGKPVDITTQLFYSFDKSGNPRETSAEVHRELTFGTLPGQSTSAPPMLAAANRNRPPSGSISVNVLADSRGKVVAAGAIGGSPGLAQWGVDSACRAAFNPLTVAGKPVEFTGTITYKAKGN